MAECRSTRPAVKEPSAGDGGPYSGYRAWKGWDDEGFAELSPATARYYDAEFAAAGVPVARGGSLLEIGFGNGGLAAWARSRGWRYVGVELDPELVRRARAHGIEAHPAGAALELAETGRFDVVVAFDVLEHLPREETAALLRAVSNGLPGHGCFIARFPSGDSPFARALQHGDLTHRAVIGAGIVEQLAAEADLEVMQVRAPVLPVAGLGLRRAIRRSLVKAGRSLVNRILRWLYFDGRPAVIEANMLIVLRPRQARAVPGGTRA